MTNTRSAQAVTLNDVAESFHKADKTLTVADRFITLLMTISNALEFLKSIFAPLPYVAFAIFALMQMLNLMIINLSSETPLATKIFKTVAIVAVLALAIAGLVIVAPYLPFVFAAISAAMRTWDLAAAIFNRFTGDTSTDNKTKKLNGEIAEKCHMIGVSAVSIVGLVLLAVCPIAGAAILLGVAVYLVADKLGYNPLRMLMNKIFNDPFKVTEEAKVKSDTFIELQPCRLNTKPILQTLGVVHKPTSVVIPNAVSKKPVNDKVATEQAIKPKKHSYSVFNDRAGIGRLEKRMAAGNQKKMVANQTPFNKRAI